MKTGRNPCAPLMKQGRSITRVACVSLAAMELVSCVTNRNVGPSRNIDHSDDFSIRLEKVIDHEKDPWNYLGIWRRSGQQVPPVYVPADMSRSVPLEANCGRWVVDK